MNDEIQVVIQPPKVIQVTVEPAKEISVEVYQGVRGLPGKGVAAGGLSGQVLSKKTDDDYDTQWITNTGGGGTSTTFIYSQITAASSWDIIHNLGKYPSVSVVDSSGNEVMGDVEYVSSNELIITFSSGFGGIAYLN